MKKIALTTFILTFCAATYSFAACSLSGDTFTCDGSSPNWTVNLSKNVVMDYSVEATNYRYYTVATGHTSGDKIYATSQADTKIYYMVDDTPTETEIKAGDLAVSATSPYSGTTNWTAM